MIDTGKLVFDYIFQLIIGVIDEKLESSGLSYLEQRKIKRRVEDATAEVVESIVPFLQQEKVSQEKLDRLIGTCISELKPYTENPMELFKGSLDGQKIFENLYHEKELPQVIVEDGLKDTYSLLFPRIATLLCKLPAAVKDWENEAWSENYRRFDEVVSQLKSIFSRVDELANAPKKGADTVLTQFKRMLTQKVGLQLDITGLRADQPYTGKFDDFFVLPEIRIKVEGNKLEDSTSVTSPEECFSTFTKSNCLNIVLGAPGAGKSTWSKWLQRETLQSNWEGVGIRVEFRDLKVDDLPSTYELIRMAAGKQMREDLTQERIKKWLDESHVVFVLDGFDEIRPVDRTHFVEWVNDVKEFAIGCPFLLTSRPLTTNHIEMFGNSWQKWSIEPFDESRIIAYIMKWYANSPLLQNTDREIDAYELGLDWVNDETIGPLTGNPLLLSTLLMVHHLDGKLPDGRANLYRRYVDGMCGVWDERNQRFATDINLETSDRRKILRGMALHLFTLEQESIDENALIKWLYTFLPKIGVKNLPEDVLLILRERTGLIVGPGIYNFAHKTIAEFLVAESIFQGDQQNSFGETINSFHLFEHRNDDRWNTVLFLWAGIASTIDVKSFINECINVELWSLAYGLLLDQYNRFSPQVRKEFLLKLGLLRDQKLWKHNGYWFIMAGPKTGDDILGMQIKMPMLALRGLSPWYMNIYTLLRMAIRDESIDWEAFSHFKGYPYRVIWGAFVTALHQPAEWLKVLTSPIPRSTPRSDLKKFVAQWMCSRTEHFCGNFSDWVDVYKQAFPDYEGYIPLGIMSNLVKFAAEDRRLKYKLLETDINHFYSESAKILLTTSISLILPFIQETKSWVIRYMENPHFSSGDLLDLYLSAIQLLTEKKLLLVDSTMINEMQEFIAKLRLARDAPIDML
ncbi:MAG: NACHT domain-containing protein [Bellilinea sp.]